MMTAATNGFPATTPSTFATVEIETFVSERSCASARDTKPKPITTADKSHSAQRVHFIMFIIFIMRCHV